MPDKGAGLSLLIPYRDDHEEGRADNWAWLRQYWEYTLPDAEIIMGDAPGVPFSKTCAINAAFRKSSGDVLVQLDADCYIDPAVILDCACEIRKGREQGEAVWFVPYRHLYRLTRVSTLILTSSEPSNPFEFGSPPDDDQVGPKNGSEFGHWFGALIQIYPREAFELVHGMDPRFCVDEATQIFTQQGWKFHQELRIGDIVLTLNHDTGLSEWQPVKEINTFCGQHEMLSIESKTHSSLTTLNHRWPTIRRPDYRSKTGWGSTEETREWTTSGSFTSESQVPMAAEHADLPVVEKYTDAVVECVAWFWTEGHVNRLENGNPARPATITQSFVVNPAKCERIRQALTSAFGESSPFPRRGKSVVADIPRWNEYLDRGRNIAFNLNAEAGLLMQQCAPNRVPSCEFLLSLTESQLDLFIECSILGDGHYRKKNYEIEIRQKNKAAIDAFQFACILAGHCTSVVTGKNFRKGYDYAMTCLRIRQQKRFKLCKGRHSTVTLEGVVWCPTTENQTWLARRNGKTYFTGNSGWGGEDVALVLALDTLFGVHRLTSNQVLTLWHSVQSKPGTNPNLLRVWEGQNDPRKNWQIAGKYRKALRDPAAMRQLIDEWVNDEHYAEHRIDDQRYAQYRVDQSTC